MVKHWELTAPVFDRGCIGHVDARGREQHDVARPPLPLALRRQPPATLPRGGGLSAARCEQGFCFWHGLDVTVRVD